MSKGTQILLVVPQILNLTLVERSPTLETGRSRSRRSPAPRFYPLTDPVVKFLQETLVEASQGRVACSDLRYFDFHDFKGSCRRCLKAL